jgi:dihydrodipicolinate synthase/N-acetylneuraminate lyase
MRPRKGLSVPVITVVDEAGALIEADQRALVRYVIQDGYGADVVFAAGTTGEWDRLHNRVRQRVIQVCAEEVAKANAQLRLGRAERDVELWAGITAPSPEDARELEVAVEAAPPRRCWRRSRSRHRDPVHFVARGIADGPRRPAIAADPAVPVRQRRHRR